MPVHSQGVSRVPARRRTGASVPVFHRHRSGCRQAGMGLLCLLRSLGGSEGFQAVKDLGGVDIVKPGAESCGHDEGVDVE